MIRIKDETTYLSPGMLVTLKLDIPNKPTMMIVKKEFNLFRNKEKDNILKGFRCRWFTTSGQLLEAIYSTKDLIKL